MMVKTKLNRRFDVNPSRGSGTTLNSDPLPYNVLRYLRDPTTSPLPPPSLHQQMLS